MDCPVLIFALQRSGGSYVSQILSGGKPILSEPALPDDGFISPLTENVRRMFDFQDRASTYQVIKVCRFENYLDMLADRGLSLPDGFTPICLFRHPYTQIASHLYTFHEWEDGWAPRDHFWRAIEDYRSHFRLCEIIKQRFPGTLYVKYEDTLGDGLLPFLKMIYGENADAFSAQALEAQGFAYKLGPITDGTAWVPRTKKLQKKEECWINEKLGDVMEALGYGR